MVFGEQWSVKMLLMAVLSLLWHSMRRVWLLALMVRDLLQSLLGYEHGEIRRNLTSPANNSLSLPQLVLRDHYVAT